MKNEPLRADDGYKWAASGILMIGIFMTLLDTTIVDIVLPKMIAALNTDTFGIQWVIIVYLIGSAISMTLVGWLTSFVQPRFIYISGMLIFTVMSVVCSQATSLAGMVVGRALQGIGEGLVVTIGLSMIYAIFPAEQRGVATGLYGLGAMMAPAVGPTLGGLLTEHFDWPSIFFVNIPVGGLGILLALLFLKPEKVGRHVTRLNVVSFLLLSTALSTLIMFLAKGQENGWMQSDYIVTLMLVCIVSFVLYFVWELRSRNPLLDLSLLKVRNFRLAFIVLALVSFACYGLLLLVPLYMEHLRGYSTLTTGLVLLPMGIFTAVFSVLGGLVSDRVSPKGVLAVGVLMLGFGLFALSWCDLYTSKFDIMVYLICFGTPLGLCFPPAQGIAFSDLPEDAIHMGSGLTNIVRLVTGSIATSFAVTIFSRVQDTVLVGIQARCTPAQAPLMASYAKLSAVLERAGASPQEVPAKAGLILSRFQLGMASETAFQETFIWLSFFAFAAILFVVPVRWAKGRKARKVAGH